MFKIFSILFTMSLYIGESFACTKTYEGFINNKYAVTMSFTGNKLCSYEKDEPRQIKGKYFYNKYKKDIPIKGHVAGHVQTTFEGFFMSGGTYSIQEETGTFSLEDAEDSDNYEIIVIGTWSGNNGKTYPVKLSLKSTTIKKTFEDGEKYSRIFAIGKEYEILSYMFNNKISDIQKFNSPMWTKGEEVKKLKDFSPNIYSIELGMDGPVGTVAFFSHHVIHPNGDKITATEWYEYSDGSSPYEHKNCTLKLIAPHIIKKCRLEKLDENKDKKNEVAIYTFLEEITQEKYFVSENSFQLIDNEVRYRDLTGTLEEVNNIESKSSLAWKKKKP